MKRTDFLVIVVIAIIFALLTRPIFRHLDENDAARRAHSVRECTLLLSLAATKDDSLDILRGMYQTTECARVLTEDTLP